MGRRKLIWRDTRTRVGVWLRTGTLFPGTLLLFMGEPFLGVLNARKLSRYRRPKANTSPLPTLTKKHYGFDHSFNKFSTPLYPPRHSTRIINPRLRSRKITNTTHALNTSIFDIILFVGSSNKVLFGSFIALPTIWSLTRSPKLSPPRKLSTLLLNSDSPYLEGECWICKAKIRVRSPALALAALFHGAKSPAVPLHDPIILYNGISYLLLRLYYRDYPYAFPIFYCSRREPFLLFS